MCIYKLSDLVLLLTKKKHISLIYEFIISLYYPNLHQIWYEISIYLFYNSNKQKISHDKFQITKK
jgi:hypothetical protein